MVDATTDNKRTDKRINALVTVYCEHAKRFIAAYSLDLSRRGIFIKTRDPFGQGDRVDMEFVLPDCDEVLKAIGEVRWVVRKEEEEEDTTSPRGKAAEHTGMGVEFVEISERVQNSLQAYVEKLTGQTWQL
jgi:uncharacterized protein (TIGR02266 family)